MRILLPTGEMTCQLVRDAAVGYPADVVVTGRVASFLTPVQLKKLVCGGLYDIVIVSGMCTASFEDVETECGVPVFLGPRHAADLPMILPLIGKVELSRTVPADEFLSDQRRAEARGKLESMEESASADFYLGALKIGGDSRIKVLAEVMDAHRHDDLLGVVTEYFKSGADIVDIGFGFDATPDDVRRCFSELEDVRGPLAIDSQDPLLIRAALGSVDLILSLHEENLPVIGEEVAKSETAVVIVPNETGLSENIAAAESAGIKRIIADPLLQPVGSGLVKSLCSFSYPGCPLFFGAGNVAELIDADSVGINALLAGLAKECGAAVVFTSEHSDKTKGSVTEMRRAVEMMALMGDRPYPKDLGIDLFEIKEKRRRREPPLDYISVVRAMPVPDEITYDPCGNLRIGIEGNMIVAVHNGVAVRGERWDDVFYTLIQRGRVSLPDHAAYLGKELYKAELSIRFGRSFEQDGKF